MTPQRRWPSRAARPVKPNNLVKTFSRSGNLLFKKKCIPWVACLSWMINCEGESNFMSSEWLTYMTTHAQTSGGFPQNTGSSDNLMKLGSSLLEQRRSHGFPCLLRSETLSSKSPNGECARIILSQGYIKTSCLASALFECLIRSVRALFLLARGELVTVN